MELLSVKECAKILGYSRQYVWMLIMMKRLEAKRVGKVFVVEANKLNQYKLKKEEANKTNSNAV